MISVARLDSLHCLKERIGKKNIMGEDLFVENKHQFVGQYTKQINLNKYPKAIYLLEIETNNEVFKSKLILQ